MGGSGYARGGYRGAGFCWGVFEGLSGIVVGSGRAGRCKGALVSAFAFPDIISLFYLVWVSAAPAGRMPWGDVREVVR